MFGFCWCVLGSKPNFASPKMFQVLVILCFLFGCCVLLAVYFALGEVSHQNHYKTTTTLENQLLMIAKHI